MGSTSKISKVSPAKVAYHLKQLKKLFPRASDRQFLQMIWAVDALHAGYLDAAASFLDFPQAASDQSPSSSYAIHNWELETLLVQLLDTPEKNSEIKTNPFDCRKFSSVAELTNRLRKLENVESAVYLREQKFDVYGELRRIAQRQFHWQLGYFNLPQFYRYAYIYAQGKCGEYFEKVYELPITEFNFVGFALYIQSIRQPWMKLPFTLPEIGLTSNLIDKALPLLLVSVEVARAESKKFTDTVSKRHGKKMPTAFLPNVVRKFPLITVKDGINDFIAPIPELVLLRVTSGLYYDLIGGGTELLNEANDRFEGYCAAYVKAMMPRFDVRRAYRYEPKKGEAIDTPDLLVNDRENLALVIECKATKLTFLAQFAEDPFDVEEKQYRQIVKGVTQL